MEEKYQVVTESPETVRAQIEALLGEGKPVQEHFLSLLGQELTALSQTEGKTPVDEALNRATLLLVSRFHSVAQSGLALLCSGYVLQACAMSRDMIEITVLLQYLHLHPKEADAFMKAKSLKERRRFSLPKVWKTLPNGKSYKDHFDLISAMIHPSSVALGMTLRPDRKADTKLFIGSFYQPFPIALEFQSEIACTIEIVELLHEWYKSSPVWPLDSGELKVLKKATIEYLRQLRSKAGKLDSELEDTILFFKGKSIDQLAAMWKKMNDGLE